MTEETDRLIARLAADRLPARPARAAHAPFAAAVMVAGAALAATLLFGLRADLAAGRMPAFDGVAIGLYLGLALASGTAALNMARPQVGPRDHGWRWAAAMAAALPLAGLVVLVDSGAGALTGDRHLPVCLAAATVIATLTGAVLIWRLRAGAPVSPARAGLVTGVAAGAAGVFGYSLACPIEGVVHVGLGHALVLPVAALIGRAAIPPLIRW